MSAANTNAPASSLPLFIVRWPHNEPLPHQEMIAEALSKAGIHFPSGVTWIALHADVKQMEVTIVDSREIARIATATAALRAEIEALRTAVERSEHERIPERAAAILRAAGGGA